MPMRCAWHHKRDGHLYGSETTGSLWPGPGDHERQLAGCETSDAEAGASDSFWQLRTVAEGRNR